MLNSKSKKIGFFGTVVFHLLLFLVCFFSTIGSNPIVLPEMVEITYVPDTELREEAFVEPKVEVSESDEEKKVEDIITDKSETLDIPNAEDTLSFNELEIAEAPSISSELEDLFSTLNTIQSHDSTYMENPDTVPSKTVDPEKQDPLQDGYILSDFRFAISKIKPKYLCKESGTVIVRVWVNREGVTIKAEAGIRGTTESAACLLREAEAAALKTTWTPYFDAPEIQIGQITYNFYQH